MSAPTPDRRARERLDVALLDPRELVPHPRNVRQELVDLEGLTVSIAAVGVIEPLTVVQLEDGRHQLVTGHRRTAAAIAAGLDRVPCWIRRDLSIDVTADLVQAEHVGTMMAENLQREALTVGDEVRGVQTMIELGMDEVTVASRTGLDRKRVAKAVGVARLAPRAAAAVASAHLTLDQAAVVAEFEDQVDVVEDLVAAAGEGPGRFAHAVTRAQQEREAAERLAEHRAELEAAGRLVLVEGAPAPHEGFMRLSGLLHDGDTLTPEAHASCPGSAVLLEANRGGLQYVVDVEVCTDPLAHGHTYRWIRTPDVAGQSMSDEELERQRAERREVIEKNKAMEAANATRRAFIRLALLPRQKASKEVLRFAVEAIAAYPHELANWLSGQGTSEGLVVAREMGLRSPWSGFGRPEDVSLTSGEHVVDSRLPVQLLGHVAAAIEAATPKDAWRSAGYDRTRLASWLTFLVGEGYELSDIEATVTAP